MSETHLGPVDYVVVEFTDAASVRSGFDRLVTLVDSGRIRVLDLEFIHSIDGVASTIPAHRVAKELAEFDGAASGLLDRHDLDTVAADLTHGATAAVLVYEELSITEVLDAWESGGAKILSEGPVDIDDIDAALEEA
ncbi:DUF6325 family protein [Mycolicibacterium komossense]|uniref:DUF1269 domain-containing family protein n=1 Tax=Mycolicibacterium komossense TaxID=1779 RepID=A0ABT3CE46_9MYCO|nr:DUF6325 family protein [Mycolicibacterium komossense]MCV7227667.1 hypothetical protein [Mycolicibacterium komossense]